MKIFILEDDPRRMEYFSRKFYNHEIIWRDTAEEAIQYLTFNYDEMDNIFLDHDLGGKTFVSSDEFNTAYTVAKFLAEYAHGNFTHVIIHSMNPPAAIRMQELLPGSQVIPFHGLFERITS